MEKMDIYFITIIGLVVVVVACIFTGTDGNIITTATAIIAAIIGSLLGFTIGLKKTS